MDSVQSLGWLALGLTPGLGPRLAGKLLTEFGTPEGGVFGFADGARTAAPARGGGAGNSFAQPLSAAAEELAQAQVAGVRLLTCGRSAIHHPSCMPLETLTF